jgi:plasmid stabilization system protein ParE
MIPVIWSDTAKDIYANLISYLMERFGTDTALKVDDAVESLIENISNNKYLCPKSDLDINIRRCTINNRLSMIYKVHESHIKIVAFYDNRFNIQF